MEIEVEPITIDDEECFKLRLGGILYGVFGPMLKPCSMPTP